MTNSLPVRETSPSLGTKLRQGTVPWFEMVGEFICEAIVQASLPRDLNMSLIERYTDGTPLPDGLSQGLRLDVSDGKPSFRVGVFPDERADVIIDVTANAARALNTLRSDDPEYVRLVSNYLNTGEMQMTGDLSALGPVFASVHDPIVQRTT